MCTPFNVCVRGNQNPIDAGTPLVDSGSNPLDSGTPDSSVDAGAGTDAGSAPDSGTVDASRPNDDGACVDTFADALLCHSYNLSLPGSFTQAGPGAVIDLSTEQSYRGGQSLYAETGNGIESAFIKDTWLPAVFSGTLYTRAYIYLPSNASPDFTSWGLIGFKDSDAPFRALRVELNSDYVASIFCDIGDGASGGGSRSMPTDQWLCVQLTVVLDDNDGSAQFHVNGDLYSELTGADTRPFNGFSQFRAGIETGAGQAASVYVDEVVVDTSPIPCE